MVYVGYSNSSNSKAPSDSYPQHTTLSQCCSKQKEKGQRSDISGRKYSHCPIAHDARLVPVLSYTRQGRKEGVYTQLRTDNNDTPCYFQLFRPLRVDYLIMARAIMPPLDEASSKRFSFRYTSIGMISHAVKKQGVSYTFAIQPPLV